MNCQRPTTGIPSNFPLLVRSVFLLYLRGKWHLLTSLGADRTELEPKLRRFVDVVQEGVAEPLRTDRQIVPLLACAPEVAHVAVSLCGRGVVEVGHERHPHE